ncbi:MAG: hypothetical protein ABWY19_08005 [Marmoricola sp.]
MAARSTPGTTRATHVFVAPNPGRRLMLACFVVSLVVLLVGGVLAITGRSLVAGILAGAAAVSSVLLWALLQARIPQRVTLRGPHVEIRRDGQVHTFDLEDPGVDIRVRDGEIAFAHYLDRWVVVSSRDVDWVVFSDVVMHYQDKADRNAEERDKRFSR